MGSLDIVRHHHLLHSLLDSNLHAIPVLLLFACFKRGIAVYHCKGFAGLHDRESDGNSLSSVVAWNHHIMSTCEPGHLFQCKGAGMCLQITVLDESPYGWLHEMLECFNHGDMHRYDELCTKYASVLNAQPALVENERKLREKITILCLMETIFK